MRILSATVTGFRNLSEDTFVFSPRVNLLLGRNGEGKTNLLEALNYFTLGRSHRGGRSDEMIAFDGSALRVRLEIEEEAGSVVVCEYGLDRNGGRRLRIDGEPVTRRADLVGRLVTVFFDPDSIGLVRGSPQERRRFADQGWVEIEPAHLARLTAFQRALKQKTGLLRDLQKGVRDGARTRREVTAWNRELAIEAAHVCRARAAYAGLLTPFFHGNHKTLIDKELKIEFEYRPRLECVARRLTDSAEIDSENGQLEAEICDEFDYIMDSEIRRGRPLAGPQLDDFIIRLDGVDMRVFGSQGETRTAAIAMILARSDVLYGQRQIRPVLFFDDIFSELDRERTRRLQDMSTRQHQVFIASARRDDVDGWRPPDLKTWRVAAGRFTPEAIRTD